MIMNQQLKCNNIWHERWFVDKMKHAPSPAASKFIFYIYIYIKATVKSSS